MRELADTGAPLLAHAELAGPVEAATRAIAGLDPRAYETYLKSRPPAAEDEAIALLIALCRASGARVHVVHLASASALPLIRRARDEHLPFSVETTPHYLHFAAEDIEAGATPFKCAPPIRERDHQRRLWGGLEEGLVDLVVSDHSPCTPSLKKLEAGDFQAAWGGITGLQLALPVVWTEARRRGKAPVDLARRWMEPGPGDARGRSPQKGGIAKGRDADLVIWNPDAPFVVEPGQAATSPQAHALARARRSSATCCVATLIPIRAAGPSSHPTARPRMSAHRRPRRAATYFDGPRTRIRAKGRGQV